MEKENSSSNLNSKPRRYAPSNSERVNGTSNNEDSEDDAEGEYLEVKEWVFLLLLCCCIDEFSRELC